MEKAKTVKDSREHGVIAVCTCCGGNFRSYFGDLGDGLCDPCFYEQQVDDAYQDRPLIERGAPLRGIETTEPMEE